MTFFGPKTSSGVTVEDSSGLEVQLSLTEDFTCTDSSLWTSESIVSSLYYITNQLSLRDTDLEKQRTDRPLTSHQKEEKKVL